MIPVISSQMNTGNARQIATVEWQTKSLMAGCHQNLVDREVWNSDVLYSLFRWTQTQWIGDQHLAAPGHANSGKPLVVGQFCIGGEALGEWCTRYFTNFHRQFVKGGPPWQCHKVQWRVYMVYLAFSHVLPSAIDNTGQGWWEVNNGKGRVLNSVHCCNSSIGQQS